MRPPIYKRKFFINKELQGKLIFKYFILFGIGALLFTLTFSFFSSNTLSIVYDDYHLQLGTTPGILLNKILSTQWLLIVVGGVIMVVFTLLLTHRIAGPVFRFETTLKEMINKNLGYEIYLRQKDEGKELGMKINEFNRMISKEINQLKNNSERIATVCNQLEHAIKEDDGTAPATRIATLSEISKINQNSVYLLSQFKTFND